jgi:hypothetical protein
MSSIVEAMRFLGAKHCAISIFAERPDNGTNEALTELKPRLEAIGARFLLCTDLKPVELKTRQEVRSTARICERSRQLVEVGAG